MIIINGGNGLISKQYWAKWLLVKEHQALRVFITFLVKMKVDFYHWQHTLTQAYLCYSIISRPWYGYGLIINSSLPIGCQFICETKLTLKSHKMILEKSWWSFLVVAIVIAVVIAVVIVKVWSSPILPICFHFPYFLVHRALHVRLYLDNVNSEGGRRPGLLRPMSLRR